MIATSVQASGGAAAAQPASSDNVNRSRGNSTNILRDPHASLALFAPREDAENQPEAVVSPYAGGTRPRQRSFAELVGSVDNAPETVVSPYAGSTRPRQRSFTEILGDEEEDEAATPTNSRQRAESQNSAIAPKVGAGKNFQPIRLFETEEGVESAPDTPDKNASPDKFYRPNPKKFQHFEFADGSDPQDAPKPGVKFEEAPKTKHDSTWNFDDFVTPQKPAAPRGLHRHQDVRHWDNENTDMVETPVGRVQQIKPRRDAETHFEFQDDGVPTNEPRLIGRPRGSAQNTGLGLYQNNLYSEDGSAPTPGPDTRALGNITNLTDRRKDFDPHFNINDDSPQQGDAASQGRDGGAAKVSEDRMKAVKMMESNWGAYDNSPVSQKENDRPGRSSARAPQDRGITIAGDGMGGRKGTGRGWGIGDDSDEEQNPRAIPGKQPGRGTNASSIWDF